MVEKIYFANPVSHGKGNILLQEPNSPPNSVPLRVLGEISLFIMVSLISRRHFLSGTLFFRERKDF